MGFVIDKILCAGLLATVFGPSNSFLLLHVLYGSKYSSTEAPAALALYSPYILLLAVNGILEAFVHATASGSELWQSHLALLVATAVQTTATMQLVASYGTLGMILADSIGMFLRISYCLRFVWNHINVAGWPSNQLTKHKLTIQGKPSRASGKMSIFRNAVPSMLSLSAMAIAGTLASFSAASLLGKGLLASKVYRVQIGLWGGATLHICIQTLVLAALSGILYRTEYSLWQAFNKPLTKQV